jgi:predicted exporter
MSVFQVVLWSIAGLLVAALCIVWWRRDARERREAALIRRWRNATAWNGDSSARVVLVMRVEPERVRLDDGETEIELDLPEPIRHLSAGGYALITGWIPAKRAAAKGRTVELRAEDVRDVFPAYTPALNDRLMGRGARAPGFISRLFGFRGP